MNTPKVEKLINTIKEIRAKHNLAIFKVNISGFCTLIEGDDYGDHDDIDHGRTELTHQEMIQLRDNLKDRILWE